MGKDITLNSPVQVKYNLRDSNIDIDKKSNVPCA